MALSTNTMHRPSSTGAPAAQVITSPATSRELSGPATQACFFLWCEQRLCSSCLQKGAHERECRKAVMFHRFTVPNTCRFLNLAALCMDAFSPGHSYDRKAARVVRWGDGQTCSRQATFLCILRVANSCNKAPRGRNSQRDLFVQGQASR